MTGLMHLRKFINAAGALLPNRRESAVVYGMPAELVARRGAQMILPAEQIANQLIKWA